MRTSNFKAIGAIVIVALFLLIAGVASEQLLDSSITTLATAPIGTFLSEKEVEQKESASKGVTIKSVTQAPQVSRPPEYKRVAGRPAQEGDDTTPESAPEPTVAAERRAIVPSTDGFGSALTHAGIDDSKTAPPALNGEKVKAPALDKTRETRKDRIATGGDYVENGQNLPGLAVDWDLTTIMELVDLGYGIIVVLYEEKPFRAIGDGNTIFSGQGKFMAASETVLDTLSNRVIPLNAPSEERTADDRQKITRAELAFRRFARIKQSGIRPSIVFAAYKEFDAYLQQKQRESLEYCHIDPNDEVFRKTGLTTHGRILVADNRAAYIINEVQIGDSPPIHCGDSEAHLLQ